MVNKELPGRVDSNLGCSGVRASVVNSAVVWEVISEVNSWISCDVPLDVNGDVTCDVTAVIASEVILEVISVDSSIDFDVINELVFVVRSVVIEDVPCDSCRDTSGVVTPEAPAASSVVVSDVKRDVTSVDSSNGCDVITEVTFVVPSLVTADVSCVLGSDTSGVVKTEL